MFNKVAWYTANANANIIAHEALTGSMTTKPSGVEAQTFYLEVGLSIPSTQIDLTTKDGYCFAAVNNHLVDATGTVLWGTASLSYHWYTTRSGTEGNYSYSGDLTAEQLAQIGAGSGSVTITSGARTRVAKTQPSAQTQAAFATVFNVADSGSKKFAGALDSISLTIAAGGGVTFGQSAVYYSVSGELTDKTKAEIDRDEFQNDGSAASVIGSLSVAVALN